MLHCGMNVTLQDECYIVFWQRADGMFYLAQFTEVSELKSMLYFLHLFDQLR